MRYITGWLGVSRVDAWMTMIEDIHSTEARAVISVIVVIVAVAGAFIVTPYVTRRLVRATRSRLDDEEAYTWVNTLYDHLEWPFPTLFVVRALQSLILFSTLLGLLIIWGAGDYALLLLDVLAAAVPYALRILLTIALIVATIVGTNLLEKRLEEYTEAVPHFDEHQQGVTFRVLQVTIFISVGLAALSLWRVELGGLLIGAGFLGIVLGMAARQTLGSLVAGFVLMFSRPFEIGDWVEIDGKDGIVTDITVINTRLLNFDSETIIMPNDKVANSTVINRSKRDRLRLRLEVDVDYETPLDQAEATVIEALESVDVVDTAPKPQVFPERFDDSAIVLSVRFWIDVPSAPKRNRAIAAAIRAIKTAFEDEDIKIPYPQRELSGRAETGGFRVVDGRESADGQTVSYDESTLESDRPQDR